LAKFAVVFIRALALDYVTCCVEFAFSSVLALVLVTLPWKRPKAAQLTYDR